MRIVLGLFMHHADGLTAIREFLQRGYERGDINALVRSDVGQAEGDLGGERTVSQKADEPTVRALAELLGSGEPRHLPDLGPVYVANELATMLADTAVPNTGGGGLRASLQDLGLESHAAEGYYRGVEAGMLLVLLRSPDDRALEASDILDAQGGRQVFLYAPTLAHDA